MNEQEMMNAFREMPDYVADVIQEGWQACTITAIRGQRAEGRGFVFMAHDPSANRIAVMYIRRNELTDPAVKSMFSDSALIALRKGTKLYDPRDSFCLIVPYPVTDVFYTLSPMRFAPGFTPKMSDAELAAAEAALLKQEISGNTFGTN